MTQNDLSTSTLSEDAVSFFGQEIDRFLSLYSQAQGTIQTIFNYYLTFATAIIGAIFFILQSDADNLALTVSGLLLFAALIGSVYLSAISGRYAQSARYAYIVDEIRRFTVNYQRFPVPPSYQSLLEAGVPPTREAWFVWFLPTGTYEMFIALINSGALAVMVVLLALAGDAGSGRGAVAGVVLFVITLNIYNIYSRLVIKRFNNDLHARLDVTRDLTLWASSQ